MLCLTWCHQQRFHGRRRLAGADASRIAQLNFCLPSKSFGRFAAAVIEIAAVQRRWRDFRIAQCSCEPGNPALPKNWTPKFVAIA